MPDYLINQFKKYFQPAGLFLLLFLASCGKPFIKKAPKEKFFLYKNNIEVKGGNFTKNEKGILIQRLYTQLEDSSKVKTTQRLIFFKVLTRPTVYDSSYTIASANNILSSLFHLGYYNAQINYRTDTSKKKISVTYQILANHPTLIDTVSYLFKKPELQALGEKYKPASLLTKNKPITKLAVISEMNRLVDSFRNDGYYKFTAAELKVRGDTSIEALTSVSDNPFEQLSLLAKAESQKDSPHIRVAVVLNPPSDSSRLNKYHVHQIFIFPDYTLGRNLNDTSYFLKKETDYFIFRYNQNLFKEYLFNKAVTLKPGDLFNQSEYYKTLFNLTKLGVWQSVNIQIEELRDSNHLVDLYINLIPTKKYGFETALEFNYSAYSNTSNVLAGNLFGLSGSISLINRNLAKEAIKMTHTIRAGLELNSNNRGINENIINSNELSYINTTSFPRLLFPTIPNIFKRSDNSGETFINAGVMLNNRLNLFNLQSFNTSFVWTGLNKKNWKWAWSPLSVGFSYLFNESDSFKSILQENPFLKFSYNTALVAGMSIGFSKSFIHFNHPNSLSKELFTRFNLEESGLTWGLIPVLTKYKRRYIKGETEIKHVIKYDKTALIFRGFLGVGVPLLGTDSNRTLPFFKQYFGGGSNSMRAWPVRGIGPGGRPIVPFSSTQTVFNDRTGDMQIEFNAEYRYDIAQIIPNTLILKGAVFADIGNIWNLRNTKTDGSLDSAQVSFKNLYKQMGFAAGTGLRLDFNYFVLRFDFGFRFKRPEIYYQHDGWKAPDIGFNDFFKKIESGNGWIC